MSRGRTRGDALTDVPEGVSYGGAAGGPENVRRAVGFGGIPPPVRRDQRGRSSTAVGASATQPGSMTRRESSVIPGARPGRRRRRRTGTRRPPRTRSRPGRRRDRQHDASAGRVLSKDPLPEPAQGLGVARATDVELQVGDAAGYALPSGPRTAYRARTSTGASPSLTPYVSGQPGVLIGSASRGRRRPACAARPCRAFRIRCAAASPAPAAPWGACTARGARW